LRKGKAARGQFVESHIKKGIAYQIRAIRDSLGWSQERLAGETKMPQNAISRLESPDYGKPTLTTLRRLAVAFDVGLAVRFVPFTEMVDWVSGTPRLNRGLNAESLAAKGFDGEERAGLFDSQAPALFQVVTGVGGRYTRQVISDKNVVVQEICTGGVYVNRRPIGHSEVLMCPTSTGSVGGGELWQTR